MARYRHQVADQMVFERFNSPADLIQTVSNRPINSVFENRRVISSHKTGDTKWYGSDSYDSALKIAKTGYLDAVEKCRVSAEKCTAAVFEATSSRPAYVHADYVGGSPAVVRAMMGLPRDMRRTMRAPRNIPGITLIYDIGANADTSCSKIIAAGARMVALVRLFERAGVPVRIMISFCACEGSDLACCEVVLRDFGQPLNLAQIAFWLAHPSSIRRLIFAWLETTPTIKNNGFSDAYGYPVSNEDRGLERDLLRDHYKTTGAHWLNFSDFSADSDVLRIWDSIAGGAC